MFVKHRFELDQYTRELLKDLEPSFGYNGFGEIVFYRTYSRIVEEGKWEEGKQEEWYNVVIRVIEGTFSIRKDWYLKNHISWDEKRWQKIAKNMALSMFEMKWLPPGRGLWAMGTDFIYQRGGMALYNCFSGDTEFYVNGTIGKFKDYVNKEVEVLTNNGDIEIGIVKSFGIDKLKKIVFTPEDDILGPIWKLRINIEATSNHRWILEDGTITTNIRPKDRIRVKAYPLDMDNASFKQGYSYGINYKIGKELLVNVDTSYIRGFIDALVETTGYITNMDEKYLVPSTLECFNWILKNAPFCGLVPVASTVNITYGILLSDKDQTYIVEAIIDEGKEEEVFCVTEPETQTFTLAGGIPTGNCAATSIYSKYLDEDIAWLMDSLMLGVGVGFSPIRENDMKFKVPKGTFEYIIGDDREGWVESEKLLLQAYMYGASKPKFVYDKIRLKGELIKGFGGIASGPEPLIYLHNWTEEACERYMSDSSYDSVIFKTDIANQVGCCVVAGNLRRSAELACLDIDDPVFKFLKDYNRFAEREGHGWMSNNSVILNKNSDFEKLPEIAQANIDRHDLGYLNFKNFPKGRIGKRDKLKSDSADNINPCGEIPLESAFDKSGQRVREVCNIDETFPTVCKSPQEWYEACKYATLYCSTVSLLPTHQPSTNRVVARNRRIGVGIVDFTGWIHNHGVSKVIKYLRKGYKIVRKENRLYNGEAGVPEAIRITCVKPGGTTPKLPGKTSGAMYANFHYMIRRIRIARNHPIANLLKQANVPYEADYFSHNTDVFEYPVQTNLDVEEAGEVSIWQQAMNLVLLQREWSDNAVSNTLMYRPKWVLNKLFSHMNGDDEIEKLLDSWLDSIYCYNNYSKILSLLHEKDIFQDVKYKITVSWDDLFTEMTECKIYQFDPRHEENSLEPVLAAIAPLTKSASVLQQTPVGVYRQMPESGISEEEFKLRLSRIKPIDWSKLSGSEGEDERYCVGESCEILKI